MNEGVRRVHDIVIPWNKEKTKYADSVKPGEQK